MAIPLKLRHMPLVRDAARIALRPVVARRRLPGTPFTVRFRAWQHLGMLLPGGMAPEPEITAHMRRLIGPGQIVVDIGANIGLHSLLAAHLVGPTGAVHAFEPDPQSASWLLDNIRRNRLGQVTPWTLGLSDVDDVAEFHLDHKATETTSLLAGWELAYDHHDRQRLRSATARLDSLALGKVDFLKIDVEGAELRTLAGARSTIMASRPVIVLEAFGEDRVHEVGSFLADLDYEVADALGGTSLEPGGGYSGNLIATPRSTPSEQPASVPHPAAEGESRSPEG